jgi:hypothetical protein
MVVDASSDYTVNELRLALKKMDNSRILIITPAGISLPVDIAGTMVLKRPDISSNEPEDFLAALRDWLAQAEQLYAPTLTDEPTRLLQAGEYRASVIAAVTLLEATLRERYKTQTSASYSRPMQLREMVERAQAEGLLNNVSTPNIMGWLRIRNEAVHTNQPVTRAQATEIVRGITQLVQRP